MIAEHAPVHQPSSLHRTAAGCTGWKQLSMDIVQPDTVEAMEGTASHYVCESVLQHLRDGDDLRSDIMIGKQAPNGVIITEEMTDAADAYIYNIIDTVQPHGFLQALHIEHRVSIPQIHAQCYGTPDAFAFNPVTGTLYVWDYKYGHGSVNATNNWQCAAYAMGIINLLGVTPDTIVIRIIMPRCFDGQGVVREWVTDINTIRNMCAHVAQKCAEADGINAILLAGPHCRDCPAITRCQPLRATTGNIIEYVQSPVNIIDVDNDWLSVELSVLTEAQQLLKTRVDAIEETLKTKLKQGEQVNGYGLETAYGRDKWTIPPQELIDTCSMFGVDVAKPIDVITPNQAKTLMKKNSIDATVINHYINKPSIGVKLIKDTSKRARLIFKDLKK